MDIPLIDIHQSGARTIIATLDAYARDPNIAAIVLRIDSPGGSALASEQIWRAIRRAREHKPVIASLGAVAASGGYYIASAADEIWADPATLTGSIGIYYGKVDFQQLAERASTWRSWARSPQRGHLALSARSRTTSRRGCRR
ncbi:MAG: S49 family peptidase [Sandaracinaceae bacterium]|nr:S49 family peptidase [Sandaracinaceae bacterium]